MIGRSGLRATLFALLVNFSTLSLIAAYSVGRQLIFRRPTTQGLEFPPQFTWEYRYRALDQDERKLNGTATKWITVHQRAIYDIANYRVKVQEWSTADSLNIGWNMTTFLFKDSIYRYEYAADKSGADENGQEITCKIYAESFRMPRMLANEYRRTEFVGGRLADIYKEAEDGGTVQTGTKQWIVDASTDRWLGFRQNGLQSQTILFDDFQLIADPSEFRLPRFVNCTLDTDGGYQMNGVDSSLFGKLLSERQLPEWSRNYIAYKLLKHMISDIQKAQRSTASKTAEGKQRAAVEDLVTAFFFQLDREVEKVNTFFLYKRAELERRLRILSDKAKLAQQQQQQQQQQIFGPGPLPASSPSAIFEDTSLLTSLVEAKEQLHKVLRYANLNKEGFGKIMKKFDKKLGRQSKHLYMETKVEPQPFADGNHVMDYMLENIDEMIREVQTRMVEEDRTKPDLLAILGSSSGNPRTSSGSFYNSEEFREQTAVIFANDDIDALQRFIDNTPLQSSSSRNSPRQTASNYGIGITGLPAALSNLSVRSSASSAPAFFTNLLLGACKAQASKCVKYLLISGVDLTGRGDVNDRSLLHKLIIVGGNVERFFKLKAEKTLVHAIPFSPTAEHSTDDDTTVLEYILKHSESSVDLLGVADVFGRIPLHYATLYGKVNLTRLLASYFKSSWPWTDNDGHSPLFYAVLKGNALIVAILVDLSSVNVDDLTLAPSESPGLTIVTPGPLIASPLPPLTFPKGLTFHYTPLELCCKFGHFEAAKLLLERGAKIQFVDEDGETPLHHACRNGFKSIVELLCYPEKFLDNKSVKMAPLNLAEKISGWTPLFLAAIEGHLECVKVLLDAGADVNILDLSEWTAHEHAVFRGHLAIGKLLKPLTQIKKPEPAVTANKVFQLKDEPVIIKNPERLYGHHYLDDQCLVLVTLGFNDTRKPISPIEIFEKQMMSYPSLSIVISATNAIGEQAIVDLPVKKESLEPILFYTPKGCKDVGNVIIRCDVQPTYGTKKQVIGRATALLHSIGSNNGCGGRASIPIVGTQFEVIGMFHFEYLVIFPFVHKNLSINSKQTYWKSVATKVIGHRGAGANRMFTGTGNLQIGENTVLSLVTAASLGAEYVEFDVQLTKDFIPVIYHDWILSETGLDIPVSAVTLEEFHSLGPQKKKRTKSGSGRGDITASGVKLPIKPSPGSVSDDDIDTLYQRRLSLNALDSLNHRHENLTLDGFKSRPPKHRHHGGRADLAIKAPFATLKETLTDVPKNVGFNIEVKYPSIMETEMNGLNNVELNVFVDEILKCVYENAGDRSIIFSSFHPETCLMLSYKQPNYPVFFLTEGGTDITFDARCNSLQEAIRFARFADLLGIVTVSDPLIEAPHLSLTIKENGLLLFTYGAMNNDAENVDLQRRFGVDAVIVDKIVPIVNKIRSVA